MLTKEEQEIQGCDCCYKGKIKWDVNHGNPIMLGCSKYKTEECPKKD